MKKKTGLKVFITNTSIISTANC